MKSLTNMHEHNFHPIYRPDIDGLRALAILSVVIFHAFPSRLTGGFVGVDVFFVISGFLISSVIFKSLARRDFSFIEFYAHRIKRIFPALILVLSASFLFGWFTLLPTEFKQLGKHIAAGAGFIQNFVLWKEAGYFDGASELKPLMHLWSLAIEEQFYIIYPLLTFWAWRLGLNLLPIIILLTLLSFGFNVDGVDKDAVKTFFLPLTRFWELMAGAILAYLLLIKKIPTPEWVRRVIFHPVLFRKKPNIKQQDALMKSMLSCVGFLLIVVSAVGLNKATAFPGWWALAPVIGSIFLILAGPDALFNRKVLANPLMVFVGLISYPLYLWHWSLLSFSRIVEYEAPSWKIRVAAVSLSFLLAWLTYRFVEKPIRFGRNTWIKTASLSVLLAVVGFVGYSTFEKDGLDFRTLAKMKHQITMAKNWDGFWHNKDCADKYHSSRCVENNDDPNLVIMGDSHANHLYPGLAARMQALFVGTEPQLEGISRIYFKHPKLAELPNYVENNFRVIDATPTIKTAVISAYWNLLLTGKFKNDREQEYWGDSKLISKYPDEKNLSRQALVLNGLKRTFTRLKDSGVNIVFVRGTPVISPELSEHCHLASRFMDKNCTMPRAEYLEDRVIEDKLVSDLTQFDSKLIVVDPIESFCDSNKCFLMREGILYYRDHSHLSLAGSELIATLIMKGIGK